MLIHELSKTGPEGVIREWVLRDGDAYVRDRQLWVYYLNYLRSEWSLTVTTNLQEICGMTRKIRIVIKPIVAQSQYQEALKGLEDPMPELV